MRKKAVPVGLEDFERIINEDYYLDKTMLIEELTKLATCLITAK